MLHDLFKLLKREEKPIRTYDRSDLSGQTFGRLTAIRKDGSDKAKNLFYLCQCSCGNQTRVRAASLRNGNTQSCGCLRSELSRKRMLKMHL